MTWEGDANDARNSTIDALESFIASQRALLVRQRADIDRLHLLKIDLSSRPEQFLSQLDEELSDPAFKLSENGDLKLKLPTGLNWKAFDHADPSSLQALGISIPARTPLATQTSPLSELQALVKNAARTLLEPRMRVYPRVPTPPPDSDAENDADDPIAARREREQAKIRELKAAMRRGGGYGSGLRTVGMIRTDVGEEAMGAEVQIDDDDDGVAPPIGKRPGKGRTPGTMTGRAPSSFGRGKLPGKASGNFVGSRHPAKAPNGLGGGKHPGKFAGKAVPAEYIADDDEDEEPAPSYATKNIGLVVEHVRSAAASPEPDADADMTLDDGLDVDNSLTMEVESYPQNHSPVTNIMSPSSEAEDVSLPLPSPPKPTPKAKPKPKAKAKPKAKPKRAKASYEYTDDESDLALDVDITPDEEETYEIEYQDPRNFVPSVTIHPSESSSDEDIDMLSLNVHMDVDIDDPPLKPPKNKKSKASATKPKPKPKPKAPAKKKKRSAIDYTSSEEDNSDDDGGASASASASRAASASGGTPAGDKAATTKKSRKPPKPKPETYKQAWSTEEQNLLEQLLEEIPDGERFRWQKISRAMDGRRTPRQVASRVQKYFEKLKKYDLM